LPKPNLERVEKGSIGINRIDSDALVVPILGIVAGAAAAIRKRRAGRTGDLSPGHAAVGRAIGAQLTAIRVSAATVRIGCNGLKLGVDVVRVAGRNRDVDPANLIARASAHISRPAGCMESSPTVGISGQRCKIRRATASRQRSLINAIRSVLIQIVLDGSGEASNADCGDDASAGSGVGKSQASDVLAHGVETIRSARAGPGNPRII
jgi:hypothetical protein